MRPCVSGGSAAAGPRSTGRSDESERTAAEAAAQQQHRHRTDVPGKPGQAHYLHQNYIH